MENLDHSADTDYSDYWKVTKRIKKPILDDTPIRDAKGKWVMSNEDKAETFAQHLAEAVTSNIKELTNLELPPTIPNKVSQT